MALTEFKERYPNLWQYTCCLYGVAFEVDVSLEEYINEDVVLATGDSYEETVVKEAREVMSLSATEFPVDALSNALNRIFANVEDARMWLAYFIYLMEQQLYPSGKDN